MGTGAALAWGAGFAIGGVGIASHSLPLLYAGYGLIGGTGLAAGYLAPGQSVSQLFFFFCHFSMFVLLNTVPLKKALIHESHLTEQCPDYDKIVANPIDLGEIQAKVQRGEYQSREQFMDDVSLLERNCILYCKDRFPDLCDDATRLRTMLKIIVTKDASAQAERAAARHRRPYSW